MTEEELIHNCTETAWGKATRKEKREISKELQRLAKSSLQTWNDFSKRLKEYLEQNKEQGRISFDNLIWKENPATFRGYEFPCYTTFTNTEFRYSVFFDQAKFKSGANFHGAQFIGHASFVGTLFEGLTDFSKIKVDQGFILKNAKIKRNIFFNQAVFYDADFSGSTFSNQAYFNNGVFHNTAIFKDIIFSKKALFEKTHFSCKTVSFTASKFDGECNFTGSSFRSTPDFTSVKYVSPPFLSEIKIIPPQHLKEEFRGQLIEFTKHLLNSESNQKRLENLESTHKYRKLKQMAIDAADHAKEIEFFSYEMRSKIYLEKTPYHEKLIIKFYDIFSNFGQSLARPLATLTLTFLLFTAVAFLSSSIDQKNCEASEISKFRAISYQSIRNTFFFIPADKNEAKAIHQCLYGEAKVKPFHNSLINGLQFSLSAVFFFLIGLALRNRFKIK